jgi:hypothetical protein
MDILNKATTKIIPIYNAALLLKRYPLFQDRSFVLPVIYGLEKFSHPPFSKFLHRL